MRITTNMIYDRGVSSMQNLWSNILHAQQEIASNRRILSPSDDPVAAARALDVTQSRSVNAQFKTNQGYSDDNLKLLENKLTGVEEILQYMRQQAVSAGNGILTQTQLDFVAADMRSQFDALLSISNTQDAMGDFLFSGYMANTQPFQGNFGHIEYMGDQGSRTIQVSSTRFMPVSQAGSDVFSSTRSLADSLNAFMSTGNSAGVAVSVAFNPPQPLQTDTGRRYEVNFDGTNYNVIERQPGNPTPVTVTSSATVPFSFNGIDVNVTGAVAGDSFEVFAASKNMFDNLAIFVDSIERPGSSGAIGGVKFAIGNIDSALDNVLRIRAQIGSQMVELDQLGDLSADMDLQYADTLKRLQDCDHAEAISRLSQLQVSLEAAQRSFMRVSGLSLFNFLQ